MSSYEIERALAVEAFTKIGYLRRLVGEAKAQAAVDWITRAVRVGEPVVVFLEHQATLREVVRGLRRQRIRFEVLEGKTSPKERQRIIDGFQKHKFPVFIGTRAAKEGITLTSARHLLFVERFFTSADEEQAEDRIRRFGQKYPPTIWFLHAVGTVDDRLDQIVKTKRAIIEDALGSAVVIESDVDATQQLINTWSQHVDQPKTVTNLGHGAALPPLPSPNVTHAVVFYGERWNKRSAASWCSMNGYCPLKYVKGNDRFKLVMHKEIEFHEKTFEAHWICRDIKVLTGRRKDKKRRQREVLKFRKGN
jgi:hypothetical protein